MNIIGISSHFHDSACALLKDGKLVAAVAEERFSRFKNDSRLPVRSFRYCLEEANLSIKDIDYIGFYESPEKKLSRQLQYPFASESDNEYRWLDYDLPIREIREILGYENVIRTYDHHLSHAATAFYFSGFKESAIFICDGVGEWDTTSYWVGFGSKIELLHNEIFPNSVGLLYSTLTNFLGFKVLNGEYKVMGLAPYGVPKYSEHIRKLFCCDEEGNFCLNMEYFDFANAKKMFKDSLSVLLGVPPRRKESDITQEYLNIAASLQQVLEEILVKKIKYLASIAGKKNLCLSGGVALNCVAVNSIRKTGFFERIYIPSSPGDSGAATGVAALAYIDATNKRHSYEKLETAYFGPSYSNNYIKDLLDSIEIKYNDYSNNEDSFCNSVIKEILEGKVIGFFQGRMEFGPRALGNRSIIADPRLSSMRDKLNNLVKKREAFRPFAPIILEEHFSDIIELSEPCYFMSEVCKVISKLDLPAITHVDKTCRPQTINSKSNYILHKIMTKFFKITGCPVLVNTSFNVRGEPIVCSPIDALRCFGNSGIEVLAMGRMIIKKEFLTDKFIEMAIHEHEYIKPGKDLFTKKVSDSVYTFI